MPRSFNELRLPGDWIELADGKNTPRSFPLLDVERALEQIALAVPSYSEQLSHSDAASLKNELGFSRMLSRIPTISALHQVHSCSLHLLPGLDRVLFIGVTRKRSCVLAVLPSAV